MSAYTNADLYDTAFCAALKAVRQCAENGFDRADDTGLRHDIAKEVAQSWRSMVPLPGCTDYKFQYIALDSSNREMRQVPHLVVPACEAVLAEFQAMGVTQENLPW